MRLVKTYELFSLFKKNNVWKTKFTKMYNFYLKNKDNLNISRIDDININIDKDKFNISQGFDKSLYFYKYPNFEVIDMEFVNLEDYKSKEGHFEITEKEYNYYLDKCQEISNWLDDISAKKFNKSKSFISDSGKIDLSFNELDLALDEINNNIKEKMPIGDYLEFEIQYWLWKSSSENDKIVERYNLKLKDIEIQLSYDKFYCKVYVGTPFSNNTFEFNIETDTADYYHDFSSVKITSFRDIIVMYEVLPDMTRKEKREYDTNKKYPIASGFDLTPSKWETIEFIKNIKEILIELNDLLKNKGNN